MRRMDATRLFHWVGTQTDLVLAVQGDAEIGYIASPPPVPRGGRLRIVGRPGAAEPGAIVQIVNKRTGAHALTLADRDGRFALHAEVEAGDELWLLPRTRPSAADREAWRTRLREDG